MIKNQNLFITEISEEDFRNLNLVGYKHVKEGETDEYGHQYTRLVWKKVYLNKILDDNIFYWVSNGDIEDLKHPITVAIHKNNGPDPKNFYFDKYLNRCGATTYHLGVGIKHLYSTRDYFEDAEDYFRIPKKDTKSVYRVHIDLNKYLK